MHADPETLLLVALGAPLAPELRGWVEGHLLDCPACASRLEELLQARTLVEGEEGLEPLRAAASTRTWEAPAPLDALGTLGGAAVYRLPDVREGKRAPPDPSAEPRAGRPEPQASRGDTSVRFGIDKVEWIGRTLAISIPGEAPVVAIVDEFRRLRIAEGSQRLAAALERKAALTVELREASRGDNPPPRELG
jgi:hypothetical protein